MEGYRAPLWLPGGHAQTIWPALFGRRHAGPPPGFRRERWATPDGDFVDVDWLVRSGTSPSATNAPLLVLFHGLEGSSRSHYAQAYAHCARQAGMAYAVPHFRGCSGELNVAPRAYHSGDHEEIGWMLAKLRERHAGPIVAVGIWVAMPCCGGHRRRATRRHGPCAPWPPCARPSTSRPAAMP